MILAELCAIPRYRSGAGVAKKVRIIDKNRTFFENAYFCGKIAPISTPIDFSRFFSLEMCYSQDSKWYSSIFGIKSAQFQKKINKNPYETLMKKRKFDETPNFCGNNELIQSAMDASRDFS